MSQTNDSLFKNPPRHVAIIMDGNGRWAKERGRPRIDGHLQGAKQIREVVSAAEDCGVKYLTLFAFSSENWNRPKEEVDALMGLLKKSLLSEGKRMIDNHVRFRTIGDIDALPQDCRDEIEKLKKATKNFTHSNLILALNYGSRDEICRAVKKISTAVAEKKLSIDEITWEKIENYLDTDDIPDPDLVIRTSGEMRLSNYLMMQAAYAELYFTKTYWPEFGREEFIDAIAEYEKRERRYGLTTDQLKK